MSGICLDCIGDKLIWNSIEYSIADLYTDDFYKFIDNIADEYSFGHIYDDVLYLYFFLDFHAVYYFILKNNINEINISNCKNALLFFEVARMAQIKVNGYKPNILKRIIVYTRVLFKRFGGMLYLLIHQLGVDYKPINPKLLDYDFCIIRDKASREKIKPRDGLKIFYEDSIGSGNLYSVITRRKRMKYALESFGESGRLNKCLKNDLKSKNIKFYTSQIYEYFSLRFVAISFFEKCIDDLFSMGWKRDFITGDNIDMYALVEENIANQYKIKIKCIPHGLEYGFKLPHCFIGDLFYSMSDYSAEYLNLKYNTNKFVYDESVTAMALTKKGRSNNSRKKIVYFSEPRDVEVNMTILSDLIKQMSFQDIPLYIKFHPADRMEDYKPVMDKLIVIDNLEDAICGSICIARKSTVLLEALYNGSISGAILVSEKDKATFNTFPSLNDGRINIFYNTSELCKWIINNYTD